MRVGGSGGLGLRKGGLGRREGVGSGGGVGLEYKNARKGFKASSY